MMTAVSTSSSSVLEAKPSTETSLFNTPKKRCTKCGRVLPLSEFDPHNKSLDGLHKFCRECGEKKKEARIKALPTPETARPSSYTPQPGNKATLTLADFTDENIFAELRRRGYNGELHFSKVYTI